MFMGKGMEILGQMSWDMHLVIAAGGNTHGLGFTNQPAKIQTKFKWTVFFLHDKLIY
jgi:hypothetical protein